MRPSGGSAYTLALQALEDAVMAGDVEGQAEARKTLRDAATRESQAERALLDAERPRPTFDELLADPTSQLDPTSIVLRSITKDRLLNAKLCDDDGIVRGGPMHHGTDYPCTGSAHFAGEVLHCTTPVHGPPANWVRP